MIICGQYPVLVPGPKRRDHFLFVMSLSNCCVSRSRTTSVKSGCSARDLLNHVFRDRAGCRKHHDDHCGTLLGSFSRNLLQWEVHALQHYCFESRAVLTTREICFLKTQFGNNLTYTVFLKGCHFVRKPQIDGGHQGGHRPGWHLLRCDRLHSRPRAGVLQIAVRGPLKLSRCTDRSHPASAGNRRGQVDTSRPKARWIPGR